MRLELSEGTSNKFWEITRKGNVLHIAWGRIGTDGQSQDKKFASPEAAQKEHDKLVASKKKKGYAEAGRAKTKAAPMAATPAKAVAVAPTNGTAFTRPKRELGLMEASGIGQMGASDMKTALKYADRAHYVQYVHADKKLTKLRVRKLELYSEMPSWIGELKHLRTLVAWAPAKLPPSLFSLPHLRFLHIDSSPKLKSLDGLEKLRSLKTVTCEDTPIAEEDGAIAAYAKKVGAKPTSFIVGLDFKPAAPKPPRDKKVLTKAINDDTLADESDLRKVDLSGATFEHAYITHDLRGAKLANTVWKSCDFERAKLAGADISGATFYDCYFGGMFGSEGMFEKAKAAGATFVGCGGELELPSADLRDAKILGMDDDFGLDLTKANAQKLTLQASFCSEKEHRFDVKGADLRGAQVFFDITEDRRAELKKKKTARLAWKTDHLKGAKTDKTTAINYASLDAASVPATRPAEATVDPKGPAAPVLGVFYASNASLWVVVADSDVAQGWRGAVDEDDPKDDFQRALKIKNKPIAVGNENGICVEIGYRSGWSHIFGNEDGDSIRLVDASVSESDRKKREREMALRMGQWPVTTKPKTIGTFVCPTGIITIMMPYQNGTFPPAMRKQAKPGIAITEPNDYDRALVAMASGPGLYEVVRYPFRPDKGNGDYEDDLGDYGDVIEISYRDALPKRYVTS